MSLIYLDNSATSFPKAPGVADAVKDAILNCGSSGRASYDEALNGSRILYQCRENLAELFHIKDSGRIILNSGATESLNTVINGFIKEGSKILTSSIEHNSVMRLLDHLKTNRRVDVRQFKCHTDGSADMNSYEQELAKKPDLVIICHSSNVTGVIFPVKEMISKAHDKKVQVCLDGAQSAGHEDIDLIDLDVDFFCFSGHKGLLGPQGTGGFYIKESLRLSPLIFGGTGSYSENERQPELLPDRFESGTRNIPGFAGLSASVGFILTEGSGKIQAKEQNIIHKLYNELLSIKGVHIQGPTLSKRRNSVISFTHETMEIDELTERLNDEGIALRMGLHCSPSAHKTMGTFRSGGTIRLSPGYFNTEKDIEKTISSIRNILHER